MKVCTDLMLLQLPLLRLGKARCRIDSTCLLKHHTEDSPSDARSAVGMNFVSGTGE